MRFCRLYAVYECLCSCLPHRKNLKQNEVHYSQHTVSLSTLTYQNLRPLSHRHLASNGPVHLADAIHGYCTIHFERIACVQSPLSLPYPTIATLPTPPSFLFILTSLRPSVSQPYSYCIIFDIENRHQHQQSGSQRPAVHSLNSTTRLHTTQYNTILCNAKQHSHSVS